MMVLAKIVRTQNESFNLDDSGRQKGEQPGTSHKSGGQRVDAGPCRR
jgi:hypothetical protein